MGSAFEGLVELKLPRIVSIGGIWYELIVFLVVIFLLTYLVSKFESKHRWTCFAYDGNKEGIQMKILNGHKL